MTKIQTQIKIEPATELDQTAILDLLTQNNLPIDGLSDHWSSTLVARANGSVIGSAALEVYDDGALLRSVAVTPAYRGKGLGHQLTEAALKLAQTNNITRVYLLTETAADFFPRFGFHAVERSQVPAGVQTSVEFTSACPASALAMELNVEKFFGDLKTDFEGRA